MRSKGISGLRRWLAGGLLLGALVGCSSVTQSDRAAAPAPTDRLGRIQNAGVMRIGVVSVLPWAMLDSRGEWVGLNVDVGRKLAADLGVRAEFVRSSWDGAADDVADGHVDLAVGLWPGPRRALVVNFSRAYAETVVTLVAPRARAAALTRAADVDQAGVRLGVRRGGLAKSVLRQQFKHATVLPFERDEDLLRALTSGELSALVSRSPAPTFIALADPQNFVLPLSEPLARRSENFAIARGDADFLSYLNTWIRAQEESGWLPQRRAYWLGSLAWRSGP